MPVLRELFWYQGVTDYDAQRAHAEKLQNKGNLVLLHKHSKGLECNNDCVTYVSEQSVGVVGDQLI